MQICGQPQAPNAMIYQQEGAGTCPSSLAARLMCSTGWHLMPQAALLSLCTHTGEPQVGMSFSEHGGSECLPTKAYAGTVTMATVANS